MPGFSEITVAAITRATTAATAATAATASVSGSIPVLFWIVSWILNLSMNKSGVSQSQVAGADFQQGR